MKRRPKAREQIVDAARRSFVQLGYHETSMDSLAAKLGMSKKTLYCHFGDKIEMLVEGLGAFLDDHTLPDPGTIQTTEDFKQQLRAVFCELSAKALKMRRPLMQSLRDYSLPALGKVKALMQERFRKFFLPVFSRARDCGAFSPEASPEQLAALFAALADSSDSLEQRHPKDTLLENIDCLIGLITSAPAAAQTSTARDAEPAAAPVLREAEPSTEAAAPRPARKKPAPKAEESKPVDQLSFELF